MGKKEIAAIYNIAIPTVLIHIYDRPQNATQLSAGDRQIGTSVSSREIPALPNSCLRSSIALITSSLKLLQ
ncbi:hypothetical protein VV11_014760 [Trichodesmium erythraeum 21-75]|nr:hypothetical protein [Trichodesmium erythraeum 21-75]